MIKLNNGKMQLCQNCGYYYNENDIKELIIKTDNTIDTEKELLITIKINLCINCRNKLKEIL